MSVNGFMTALGVLLAGRAVSAFSESPVWGHIAKSFNLLCNGWMRPSPFSDQVRPGPPGSHSIASPHEFLAVVHTGHVRRDGADDRIVALVTALPDPATALVYTSDAGLRARVHALGAKVAGARALLDEIAAVRITAEPGARDGGVVPGAPSQESS